MNEVERDSSDWVERGETMRERMVKKFEWNEKMKVWKWSESEREVNGVLCWKYVGERRK